jgi:hypothetical protein
MEHGEHSFDFDAVWRQQAISSALKQALTIAATAVHDVIVDSPPNMRNVTEWAKTEACWTRVSALAIDWPAGLLDTMRAVESKREIRESAIKDQRMLNGIEAQVAVVSAGGPLWRSVKEWGSSRHLLTATEAEFLEVASGVPGRMPSDKQSLKIIEILVKLHGEGCQLGLDIVK